MFLTRQVFLTKIFLSYEHTTGVCFAGKHSLSFNYHFSVSSLWKLFLLHVHVIHCSLIESHMWLTWLFRSADFTNRDFCTSRSRDIRRFYIGVCLFFVCELINAIIEHCSSYKMVRITVAMLTQFTRRCLACCSLNNESEIHESEKLL